MLFCFVVTQSHCLPWLYPCENLKTSSINSSLSFFHFQMSWLRVAPTLQGQSPPSSWILPRHGLSNHCKLSADEESAHCLPRGENPLGDQPTANHVLEVEIQLIIRDHYGAFTVEWCKALLLKTKCVFFGMLFGTEKSGFILEYICQLSALTNSQCPFKTLDG